MPRFYFDVFDGRSIIDTDGVDLPDTAAAYKEALRIAGGAIEREACRIATGGVWNMEVRDEVGQQLIRIDLNIRGATAAA